MLGHYDMKLRDWERKNQSLEMPWMKVPDCIEIKLIPNFGGSITRFLARLKDKESESISVYYDAYGTLGAMKAPYWEIHPGSEGDTERFHSHEVEELWDAILLALGHEPTIALKEMTEGPS